MNWDDVAALLAVAKTGTARAAARQLGVSQPTVGRKIERLEKDLNLKIFERSRDGYVVTRQGAELLSIAQTMGTAARDIQNHSRSSETMTHVNIRLSASDWPAMLLATQTEMICALESRAGIRLEIDISEETAALSLRQADLAIRHGLPSSGEFVTRKIGEISCAIYGSNSYVEAHPCAETRQRFEECDWITFTHEQAHYYAMLWLQKRFKNNEPRLRASTTATIFEMTAAGGGLAILPCFLADREPRLSQVSPIIHELRSDYWLIAHKRLLRQGPVRETFDTIVQIFSRQTTQN